MIFHQPQNSLSNYNYNSFFYTDQVWDYHFHKNLELVYVVKGQVYCTVNRNEYTLCEGKFGLCLPYDIHSYKPEKDTLYWVLVFSEDFVRTFMKKIEGKTGTGFSFSPEKPVKDYLSSRLVFNDTFTILTLKSCLYAVCESYLDKITLVDKAQNKEEIIPVIADYIAKNHSSQITLSNIAEILGYDYHYMSRQFKNIFHMTYTDFVNLYRMETAIKLLEDSELSITDIAFESGFQSVRTFNCFFKKHTGITPSGFRKKLPSP